ncbi:DUF397 domain-containing protein [Saccharothrix longispora]|uniref:DUF397 domain-containing protein n=1 Tax=Saccharothrix longispora TaxID=33920 RepID=UPI0028FDBFE2|nr:DUF397 domain-containing protein [Saccharothrix longispora]MBY8851281.1 DUF397 domain-containing protein [Saccharothrix sp. MB29]MDU0289683.1 DUF397 domain-containing protein [Saccharothrix longispora]
MSDIPTGWFKSSYSGASTDNCVEVRFAGAERAVGVRDSKNTRATLTVPAAGWSAFVASMRRS